MAPSRGALMKGNMPSHKPNSFPLGKSEKMDVALNRPTVNLREAENQGEEARAATGADQPTVRFGRHGTFGPATPNPLLQE